MEKNGSVLRFILRTSRNKELYKHQHFSNYSLIYHILAYLIISALEMGQNMLSFHFKLSKIAEPYCWKKGKSSYPWQKKLLKARNQVIPKWAIFGFYIKNQKILVSYKCCENFKRFPHLVLEIFEIKVFTIFHGTTIYGSPTSI